MPRRERNVSRGPKLTPEIQAAICKQLELAVPEKYAAEANGIRESTFHEWMKKGSEGIEPYATFSDAVMRSRAKAVVNLTARALSGGNGSSQATWLLERRFRHEYGSHVSVGGVAGADPVRLEAERAAAEAIRGNPAARKLLNEAVLLAVATAQTPKDKTGR